MVICFNQYKQIIPEIDLYCERFGLDTSINIQKYEKKEAFFDWHFENSKPYEKRIFVFMTYLNDVSEGGETAWYLDRKSTRLNSSHLVISYAVFCLKKKKKEKDRQTINRDNSISY